MEKTILKIRLRSKRRKSNTKFFLITVICLFISFSGFSQKKTTQKESLSPKIVKILSTTPVATLLKGKPVVNRKRLNKKMPNGAKIKSYKIRYFKNYKQYVLTRIFVYQKKKYSNHLILVQDGKNLYAQVYTGKTAPSISCPYEPCTTCDVAIIGSGTLTCDCMGGDSGDCLEVDICDPVEALQFLMN